MQLATDKLYRLRLEQRGMLYLCEMLPPDAPGTTMTAMGAPLPAQVSVGLRADSSVTYFHSVVVESIVQ